MNASPNEKVGTRFTPYLSASLINPFLFFKTRRIFSLSLGYNGSYSGWRLYQYYNTTSLYQYYNTTSLYQYYNTISLLQRQLFYLSFDL